MAHEQAFHHDPLLRVRDLCVDYIMDDGHFRAVNTVSFDIGRGEIFGLAGESGCGKSTIAFSVNSLHKPPAFISGGEIWLEDRNLRELAEKDLNMVRWSEIAMVFQSAMNSLNPVLTVQEQFVDVIVSMLVDSPQIHKQACATAMLGFMGLGF